MFMHRKVSITFTENNTIFQVKSTGLFLTQLHKKFLIKVKFKEFHNKGA